MLMSAREHLRADLAHRVELRLRGLVRDQFDSCDQSDATNLANEGMTCQRAEFGLHHLADAPRVLDKVLLFDDVEVLKRYRCRDWMARSRKAMAERADPSRVAGDALVELMADHHRRKRLIRGGDLLGKHHDVRVDPVIIAREHGPEAAEAIDHLVRNDQDIMPSAD